MTSNQLMQATVTPPVAVSNAAKSVRCGVTAPDRGRWAVRVKILAQAANVLLFGVLMVVINPAKADSCRLVGGCVGTEQLIHVPKTQLRSAIIFQTPGLPPPETVTVLQSDVALLKEKMFFVGPYADDLREILSKAEDVDATLLAGYGNALDAGNKVLILSYKTITSSGSEHEELFAVVYVMTE